MAREIKFRMWDNEQKCFYTDGFSIDMDGYRWHDDNDNSHDFGDRFSLQQYTGLKDKNGKEIYEGDITYHSAHEVQSIITWHDTHICFAGFDKGTPYYYQVIDEKSLEVIGNIYENPELLTTSQEGKKEI